MSHRCEVRIRFCQPPPELARYFTTFYLGDIEVTEGGTVTDHLHPEWGNLRFHTGALVEARNYRGESIGDTGFSATGPSSRALRFTLGTCRIWGIGLLPLGWAKFVATPAASLADAVVDGGTHPAFSGFRSLADSLFGAEPDPDAELARIAAWFMAHQHDPLAEEARIQAMHTAMTDPFLPTVAELPERVGASMSSIERLCHRAFGFSPQLLLRRQRFMRSLAQFMLDPSLKWIGAVDGYYHDHSHFVRDFRQFMGMTPRQYASMKHPILDAFVAERARIAGAAVQTLDLPRKPALPSSRLAGQRGTPLP